MTGIFLIDKEQGWTSSDVVARLRRVLGERRIGHAGTLDPLATGLLIVMVGRATRASDYLMKHDKRYLAHLRLGIETDTQDITGQVIREKPCRVSPEEVKAAAERFLGTVQQMPPMYSAIKVRGRKLYEIARRGETVERKARTITISSLSIAGMQDTDYILDISCSSGTYVRTLCHDIGQTLGCGGCMTQLRRLASGCFTVDMAHTVEEISKADRKTIDSWIIPTDKAFSQFEELTVNDEAEKKLRCGTAVAQCAADGKYRVYSTDGTFLMLGYTENGILRTEKSFFEVNR